MVPHIHTDKVIISDERLSQISEYITKHHCKLLWLLPIYPRTQHNISSVTTLYTMHHLNLNFRKIKLSIDLWNVSLFINISPHNIRTVDTGKKLTDININCHYDDSMIEPRHEKPGFCHMRTTKAHISLRIRTVWSAPLLFAALIV